MTEAKEAARGIHQAPPAELHCMRHALCVAFGTASRSILGLKLSNSPAVADSKAVLRMSVRDKAELTRQLGSQTEWKQLGHIYRVSNVTPSANATLAVESINAPKLTVLNKEVIGFLQLVAVLSRLMIVFFLQQDLPQKH
ncbi:hypothetical protein SLH49_19830 [Cognatiyoonia sp. IB215446]|uniref:hypothetical protein n=1 Tax=Cognatiyoonia sp. IB215446 TaxID=3097355 RepID=UPI002A0AE8CB|nr:hypothetical protein [Cognatiyoonia sp. IB215446]MDX8350248.1 hypothetical protein [Cognatiyoonia sp. IB215446]